MEKLVRSLVAFEEALKCPLCNKTLLNPHTLQECGHHFCEACIIPYIGQHCACPKCKIPAALGRLMKNLALEDVVLNLAKFKDWSPLALAFSAELSPHKGSKKYSEENLNDLIFVPPPVSIAVEEPSARSTTQNDTVASKPPSKTPQDVSGRASQLEPSKSGSTIQNLSSKSSDVNSKKISKGVKEISKKRISFCDPSDELPESVAENRSTEPSQPIEVFTDSRLKWSCVRCTFLNLTRAKKCKICLTPRDAVPFQPPSEETLIATPVRITKPKLKPGRKLMFEKTRFAPRKEKSPAIKHTSPVKEASDLPQVTELKSPGIINLSIKQKKSPRIASNSKHTTDLKSLSNPDQKSQQQLFVILTGFLPAQKKEMTQLLFDLNHVGLKIKEIDKVTDFHKATHLVTCFAPDGGLKDNVCSRTIKYLHGLICNIPIVEQSWLADSLHHGAWQNTNYYLLNGTTTYGPLETVVAPLSNPIVHQLFLGYTFYFKGFSINSVPTKSELLSLIKASGGKVISNLPLVKDLGDSELIDVLNPTRFALKVSPLGHKYMIPVSSSDQNIDEGHKPSITRAYSLCLPMHNPSPKKQKQRRKADFDLPKASSSYLKLPLPSKLYPLVITVDKSSSDTFTSAPESLHDQSAPYSWILDCISARSILPLPFILQAK